MVSVEGGKTRVSSSGQFLFRVLGNFCFRLYCLLHAGVIIVQLVFITVLFYFSLRGESEFWGCCSTTTPVFHSLSRIESFSWKMKGLPENAINHIM